MFIWHRAPKCTGLIVPEAFAGPAQMLIDIFTQDSCQVSTDVNLWKKIL